jgi:hypothetical protein
MILSVAIETPGAGRKVLWYSIPERQEAMLARNADPFVAGLIYLIMESGHDVQVHGEVSPSLLRNLEEFQAAWVAWVPGLGCAAIRADREAEAAPSGPREDAVVAFSGGVDSCFTAFRQVRAAGPRIPYRPTAGVMVHGFDIPLGQPEMFASAVARSRALLSSLGLELIPMATNYRELVKEWSHSFGAAVASCLMLFSGRFRAGLIGQGFTYSEFCILHEGSNPLTDQLLSTDSFKVVPDGTAFDRASKIFAMRDWDEFLRHLRVCWEGPDKDRNCCKCEKCVRNILTFRALGLGLPACFDHDIEDQQISTLRLGAGALPYIRYGGLAGIAAAHGVAGSWIEILEKRLSRMRRHEQRVVMPDITRLPYYCSRIWSRLLGRG